MKYTKEQLQECSDDEIDEILSLMVSRFAEYCNNPSDIMPLAFDNELTLQRVNKGDLGYWVAGPNTYHSVAGKNPLRAIACCLILVLQEGEE